jgi:hypothetical protein
VGVEDLEVAIGMAEEPQGEHGCHGEARIGRSAPFQVKILNPNAG